MANGIHNLCTLDLDVINESKVTINNCEPLTNRKKNRKENSRRRPKTNLHFDMCSYNLLKLFLKFKAMVYPAPRREAIWMQLRGDLRTHTEDRTMDEIIWWLVCWGLWQHNIHSGGCCHQILASGVHRVTKSALSATN